MENLWLKVENMVSKGEIACFEQFLLLSLCFKKPSAAEASESFYMRERVKVVCCRLAVCVKGLKQVLIAMDIF